MILHFGFGCPDWPPAGGFLNSPFNDSWQSSMNMRFTHWRTQAATFFPFNSDPALFFCEPWILQYQNEGTINISTCCVPLLFERLTVPAVLQLQLLNCRKVRRGRETCNGPLSLNSSVGGCCWLVVGSWWRLAVGGWRLVVPVGCP